MPRPPFNITPRAAALLAEIHRRLGVWQGLEGVPAPAPRLRRENRIRTVRDSLAIEGNTLSLEQVTAILNGRRVVGPRREITEVRNAIAAYDRAVRFNPMSERSLLAAHGLFMRGLLPDAGRYRQGGIGVWKGSRVAQVAPPADRVPRQMADLFAFLRSDRETPGLIKAAVFHYELELIHPFTDGNGRLGRFWQHLLLRRESTLFEHLPAESQIRARQAEYYRALERSDRLGSCDPFIELILSTVLEGIEEIAGQVRISRATPARRLDQARPRLGRRWFTRRDYLALFPSLSVASASRDLRAALDAGLIESRGARARTAYRFVGS